MKKIFAPFALLLSALTLCLCIAGCSGASATDTRETASYYSMFDSASDHNYYSEAVEDEVYVTTAAEGIDLGTINANVSGDAYGGRKIIRNYEISYDTSTFDDDISYIEARISELGGYVLNSNLNGSKPQAYGDPGRRLELTLRIPAEKASEFVSGVEALGELNYMRDYTDDITDEYYDTDTRLAVLKDQLERLRAIMVETDNLADIIALESRISEVMLEIESLTGTLKRYDALIDYTTVYLYIYETNSISGPAATKSTAERISEGFTKSINGVGVFFVDLFVWFVSSLPVLLIAAAAVALIIIIVRICTRKKAKAPAQGKNDIAAADNKEDKNE